jgi:hypothetical protein
VWRPRQRMPQQCTNNERYPNRIHGPEWALRYCRVRPAAPTSGDLVVGLPSVRRRNMEIYRRARSRYDCTMDIKEIEAEALSLPGEERASLADHNGHYRKFSGHQNYLEGDEPPEGGATSPP